MTIPARYRCTACGNLTRFDVIATRRTREYYHFTVGGELEIETAEMLDETVDDVSCRWCGRPDDVVELDGTTTGDPGLI